MTDHPQFLWQQVNWALNIFRPGGWTSENIRKLPTIWENWTDMDQILKCIYTEWADALLPPTLVLGNRERLKHKNKAEGRPRKSQRAPRKHCLSKNTFLGQEGTKNQQQTNYFLRVIPTVADILKYILAIDAFPGLFVRRG